MACLHVATMVVYWATACTTSAVGGAGNILLRRGSGSGESHKIDADADKWAWGRGASDDHLEHTAMLDAYSVGKTHEKKVKSQNGEDGILQRICDLVGCSLKTYVEFGANDAECSECNTRHLRNLGWKGLMMGHAENLDINLRKEEVLVDNVVELFQKYGVPKDFDVLSVDVDGIDFYVLRSVLCSYQFNPKIIAVEYNAHIPATRGAFVTPLTDPPSVCTGYCNGMSLGALKALASKFDYELIYTMSCGVNAFLVRRDVLPSNFRVPELSALDRPETYMELGADAWQKAQPRWDDLPETMLLKECEAPEVASAKTESETGQSETASRVTSVYTDGKHEQIETVPAEVILAHQSNLQEEGDGLKQVGESNQHHEMLEQGLHKLAELAAGQRG